MGSVKAGRSMGSVKAGRCVGSVMVPMASGVAAEAHEAVRVLVVYAGHGSHVWQPLTVVVCVDGQQFVL